MRHLTFITALIVSCFSLSTAVLADAVKSAKECNEEWGSRRHELASVGENLHDFIEDCWWHSPPGTLTPLRAVKDRSGRADRSYRAESDDDARRTADRPRIAAVNATRARRLYLEGLLRGHSEGRDTMQASRAKPARAWAQRVAKRAPERRGTSTRVAERQTVARPMYARQRAIAERRRLAILHAGTGTPQASSRQSTRAADRFNGRRAWVRIASPTGMTLRPAIVLVSEAIPRQPLHCWDQQVVLWNRREGARQSDASVCNGERVETDPEKTTFVSYR